MSIFPSAFGQTQLTLRGAMSMSSSRDARVRTLLHLITSDFEPCH